MARDPRRIYEVLEYIQDIWEKYPDLRLGQLLCNCVKYEPALYFLEDDELIKKLTATYHKESPSADKQKES